MSKPITSFAIFPLAAYAIVGFIGVLTLIYGKFILSPILYGIFFAILIAPATNFLQKYIRFYPLSFITATLFSLMIMGTPILLLYANFGNLITDLTNTPLNIPRVLEIIQENTEKYSIFQELKIGDFMSYINDIATLLLSFAQTFVQSSGSFIFTIGFAFIFAYYFSASFTQYKNTLYQKSDPKHHAHFDAIIQEVPKVVRSYVKGILLVTLILAILNSIAFVVIGLNNAIFWGVIIGIFAIIPYIGPFLAILLVLIYSTLSTGALFQPFLILICFVIIQQIEGNFITPKVVGDQINISPLFVILLVLFFGRIWGVEGIIICLPMAGVIRAIINVFDDDNVWVRLISPSDE